MPAKKPSKIENELRVWSDVFNSVADLQREIDLASKDMTLTDDWTWLEPYRQIVTDVWQTLAQTPPDKRIQKAGQVREQAQIGIIVVHEKAQRYKAQKENQ